MSSDNQLTIENGQLILMEIKAFDALTLDELYDLLKLRGDVFVKEQKCAYADLDGKDRHKETLHLTGRTRDGRLAAYLRILAPGVSYPDPGFGRLVVAPGFRGQGISHGLVEKAVSLIQEQWPGRSITIGAQEYLEKFYESHGFRPMSAPYPEDGIPHIDMTRNPG